MPPLGPLGRQSVSSSLVLGPVTRSRNAASARNQGHRCGHDRRIAARMRAASVVLVVVLIGEPPGCEYYAGSRGRARLAGDPVAEAETARSRGVRHCACRPGTTGSREGRRRALAIARLGLPDALFAIPHPGSKVRPDREPIGAKGTAACRWARSCLQGGFPGGSGVESWVSDTLID